MITSTSSSQVKHVISLLSKARERKKNKEYVVEGVRMVSEVPADLLVKIYMSERFHSNNPEYVHWWTFLSFFMEIGDGLFSQVLSIRHLLQRTVF